MGSSTETNIANSSTAPPTPITRCHWLWDKWFIYYDCIQIVLSTFAATWIFTEINYLYICFHCSVQFSSVQSLIGVRLFAALWTAAHKASLSITNSRNPPKPMSIESVIPSNHLILCHPLLLLPSNLSQHQCLFQWVSSLHQVAKVLEFELQHQSFQWTPELISFRMHWLDLLAVQGTLKSLLQHRSSKASVLQCSAFFIVQLSHPYMTTGKTHSLDLMDICWQSKVSAFEYAV